MQQISDTRKKLKAYIDKYIFHHEGDRWGFEFRPHLLNPEFISLVSAHYIETCPFDFDHQVCGVEFSGVPISLSIAMARGDNSALVVRKSKKSFANKSTVEGLITNQPVVLVDDVISSGDSLLRAHGECKEIRLNPIGFYTIVDFLREEVDADLQNLKHWTAFDLTDFGIDAFVWKP